MNADLIQTTIDVLKYADNKIVVLAALCGNQNSASISRLMINDAIEKLSILQLASAETQASIQKCDCDNFNIQNNPASLSTDSSPVDAHPAIVNQHDAPADALAGGSPSFRPVILESPYAGDVAANMAYAHNCVRDSLSRGESPYASHIMLTTALDDTDPVQRHTGIHAGFTWASMADAVVIYTDRGISPGMYAAIRHHQQHGRRIEYRKLEG